MSPVLVSPVLVSPEVVTVRHETGLARPPLMRHDGPVAVDRASQGTNGVTYATLSVDGRACRARPMRGSGLGAAHGLAVVARTEQEVHDAVAWMPGRVLVILGEAVTRATIPVVVHSAHLATFAGIVVVTNDLQDLGHMGQGGLPIPVVVVSRVADMPWMLRAVRISVGVHPVAEDEIDIRSPIPNQRRGQSQPATPGTPGTVRH